MSLETAVQGPRKAFWGKGLSPCRKMQSPLGGASTAVSRAIDMPMRPDWRLPLGNFKGRSAFPANFVHSAGLADKRQCKAMARSTGKQCRQPAMQGATCCRMHGGHKQAYKAERAKHPNAVFKARPDGKARAMLARIGASARLPDGAPHDESIIARGLAVLTQANGD